VFVSVSETISASVLVHAVFAVVSGLVRLVLLVHLVLHLLLHVLKRLGDCELQLLELLVEHRVRKGLHLHGMKEGHLVHLIYLVNLVQVVTTLDGCNRWQHNRSWHLFSLLVPGNEVVVENWLVWNASCKNVFSTTVFSTILIGLAWLFFEAMVLRVELKSAALHPVGLELLKDQWVHCVELLELF
jgi:hypothetical protein